MAIKDWNGFKKSGDTYIPNDATARAGVTATVDLMKDTTGWIGGNEVDVAKYNHISTNCVANAVGDVMTFTAPITATGQYAELSYYASQTSDILFDHNVKRKMMIIVTALTSNKAAIGVRNSESRFIKTLKFESTGTYILDLSDVAEDYYVGVYPRWEYNNAEASMTFKLMLLTEEQYKLNPSYRPYHESVEEYAFSRSEQAVLGAKNLLPNNNTTQTINGIPFTKNADGSVTIGAGTASANTSYILGDIKPKAGNYILSRGTTNGQAFLSLSKYNGSTWVAGLVEIGNQAISEKEFTVDYNGYNTLRGFIYIGSGVTISTSYTVYPMVRSAAYLDDTYVPYAMTNMELTENKWNKDLIEIPSSADLDDYKTVGGYYWGGTAPSHAPENQVYSKMIILNAQGIRHQIVIRGNGYMAMRQYDSGAGVWKNWYKFTSTEIT